MPRFADGASSSRTSIRPSTRAAGSGGGRSPSRRAGRRPHGFGGRRYASRARRSRPTATRSTTTSASSSRGCARCGACSPAGTLYFHIDYREAHYCKLLLDELFGRECFLNEIIWAYDYGARPRRRWPAKHDTILVYVKDPDRYWFDAEDVEREPYMAPGLVTAEKSARGKLPTDVWWHTIVSPTGKEKTGYPTQKPAGIVRRMVAASTRRATGASTPLRARHPRRRLRRARPPLRADRHEPGGNRRHPGSAWSRFAGAEAWVLRQQAHAVLLERKDEFSPLSCVRVHGRA